MDSWIFRTSQNVIVESLWYAVRSKKSEAINMNIRYPADSM